MVLGEIAGDGCGPASNPFPYQLAGSWMISSPWPCSRVATGQLMDLGVSHPVGGDHLGNRAALGEDSSDHKAGFVHAGDSSRAASGVPCASVRYVIKQGTSVRQLDT